MRSRLATIVALLAALAATRLARAEPAPVGSPPAILLIVADDSPVQNLPLQEVRRIFTGESRNLRPLNLPPGTPERVALDSILLGRGPDDVARYWIERKIRGQGGPPRVIPSAHLMARIVAHVPLAIGYHPDGPLPPGVKALRIDDLPHTHPRYPLTMRSRSR
jgi:hypothetical protein